MSTHLVDGSRGGTEAIVLVSVSGHSVSIGFNRFFPTPIQSMTTATAIINGNTIEADVETIAKILSAVTETVQTVTNTEEEETIEEDAELEKFDDFIRSILKGYFAEEGAADAIVNRLSEILHRRYPNFRDANGLYHHYVGNLKQRNLMKVVFASYALQKSHTYVSQYRNTLTSKIKYATMCDHCGVDGAKIRDRLIKEGYVKSWEV